jgi:hypothetical protein
VGEQQYFRDARLPAEEFDPRLHVERQLLEIDQRLIVLVARIHAKHEKAAAR